MILDCLVGFDLEKVLGAEFEARPIAEQTIALHVISVAENFMSLNKVSE